MRLRLVAVLLGLTAMILVVHDVPLAAHLRRVERDRLITGLERDGFTIAARAQDLLDQGAAALPDESAALTALLVQYRSSTGARVIVTDRTGAAVVSSDEEAIAGSDYSTRPEVQQALAGTPAAGERDSATLGIRLEYVAVPVVSGTEIKGAVRITYPASVIGDRVESRVRGLLVVALVSLAVALAAAVLFAQTITRPLRRLRAATEHLADGDLSVRAATDDGPPEVRSLATSFNTMGERIERMMVRQRAFAGDASHQLRTPLTALRLRLEQVDDALERDPASARVRLESATAETDRLQRLIEGLLTLARAEGRQPDLGVADASAVLGERVELWQALAEEQGVEVALSVPPSSPVVAVPGALEQIIDNLVDNALQVVPSGSTVEVVAAVGPTITEIHVLDRGPGMTPDQMEHAFDRFWRAADAPPGGSGLGLAIVASLAEASGGTVNISARAGGGLDVRVALRTARV
ncbi:MAG: ATP-binding protein [Acidimicrobiia bacterium]